MIGLRDHSNSSYELDVYLLDVDDPTGTETDLYYHGPSDTSHALVGSRFIDSGSNTDVTTSSFQITSIPKPATALLGGLGMVALLRRQR